MRQKDMLMSENNDNTKQCTKCKQWFPATLEYFYKVPRLKYGVSSVCRPCNAEKQTEARRAKGAKPYNLVKDGMKKCRDCEITFPATKDYFRFQASKSRLFPVCHDCEHKRDAKKRSEQPERFSAIQKRFRVNNPERAKEIKQKWVDNNGIYIKQQSAKRYLVDKEKILARNADYVAKHPEKKRARVEKRRRLSQQAEGDFTENDLKQIYDEQNGKCAYCGISVYWEIPKDIHVDHIHPLSRGGTNWPHNICLACASCNLTKGEKTVSEWELVRGW